MSQSKTFLTTFAVLLFSFLVTTNIQPVLAASTSDGSPTNPVINPAGNNYSYNWAGYVATGDMYTGVAGSWKIPTVPNANTLEADATWVGIGGVTTHDLIQAGTVAIIDGNSPQPTYHAWYETLPNDMQQISMPVNPGDTLSTNITTSGNDQWQISIRDLSNNQSFSTTVTYTSSLSSVEWIEETPSLSNGFIAPLDNFGTVSFTGGSAVVNGISEDIAHTNATPMTMLDGSDQALASPTAIAANGTDFSVNRSDVASSSVVPTFYIIPFRYRINTTGMPTTTTTTTSYTSGSRHHHRFQFEFTPNGVTQFSWSW